MPWPFGTALAQPRQRGMNRRERRLGRRRCARSFSEPVVASLPPPANAGVVESSAWIDVPTPAARTETTACRGARRSPRRGQRSDARSSGWRRRKLGRRRVRGLYTWSLRSNAPKKSWPKRHHVLTGMFVGAGIGASACPSNGDCTGWTGVYAAVGAGEGAGFGALVGWLISR